MGILCKIFGHYWMGTGGRSNVVPCSRCDVTKVVDTIKFGPRNLGVTELFFNHEIAQANREALITDEERKVLLMSRGEIERMTRLQFLDERN